MKKYQLLRDIWEVNIENNAVAFIKIALFENNAPKIWIYKEL